MNPNESTELIDRYLYAVGDELPRTQRDDITRELRTLIEEHVLSGAPADAEAWDSSADTGQWMGTGNGLVHRGMTQKWPMFKGRDGRRFDAV